MNSLRTLASAVQRAAISSGAAPRFSIHSSAMAFADRSSGVTKWFNNAKGFGFIVPDDGGKDVFVHHTQIKVPMSGGAQFRSLREGEPVEFGVETDAEGRAQAVDVTGPDGAAPQGAPMRPEGGHRRRRHEDDYSD